MKALRIREFGGPSLATLDDVPLAAPGPGQVSIRVEAASVNPLDLKIAAGYMQPVFPVTLPYTLGTDIAGVVESIAPDISSLRPGDRVVGRLAPQTGGAFAQHAVIAADSLSRMPAHMSYEQAAALPTAASTALLALFGTGKLCAGQRVLIHAGAGGVGSFAVQFASQAGAYVIATGSAQNRALIKNLGAHEFIDYRSEDFAERARGLDLVLDTVGGDTLERSWHMVKPGGTVLSIVDHTIKSRGDVAGTFVFFNHDAARLARILELFQLEKLQIILDTIHPLDDARAALERVAGGHAQGKVIIRTSGGTV